MSSRDSALLLDLHPTESGESAPHRRSTLLGSSGSSIEGGRPRALARFRPEPLPADYLEAILRLASQAPSEGQGDSWRFIVVREANARARLQWTEAPVVLIAFTMTPDWPSPGRAGKGPSRQIADARNGNGSHADSLRMSPDDKPPPAEWLQRQRGIVLTTMMLIAEAYGVGTEPVQCFDPEDVKLQFGIPSEAQVVALLAMGFVDEPDNPPSDPRGLHEFVHVERYGQPWMA